jgi:hypothetical protein
MKTYTIKELADRYKVSNGTVNAMIKHLAIETELIANRTRVLESDVFRLDGLQAFLKESKAHRYNDYIEPTIAEVVSSMQELELAPENGNINDLTNQNQVGQLSLFKEFALEWKEAALVEFKDVTLALIDERIKQVAIPPTPPTPPTLPKSEILAGLRELEDAVKNNWVITTSQVLGLIGKKPRGAVYVRGSFIFKKVRKQGAECGWRVYRNPEDFES